jgi:hypothetical protein
MRNGLLFTSYYFKIMFKKLLNASDNVNGIIPKIEKVANVISFLVLCLNTLRFFQKGLSEFQSNDTETAKTLGAAPAGNSVDTPANS